MGGLWSSCQFRRGVFNLPLGSQDLSSHSCRWFRVNLEERGEQNPEYCRYCWSRGRSSCRIFCCFFLSLLSYVEAILLIVEKFSGNLTSSVFHMLVTCLSYSIFVELTALTTTPPVVGREYAYLKSYCCLINLATKLPTRRETLTRLGAIENLTTYS